MEDYKFRVDFLDEAKEFLDGLDEKARDKIVYNIWKFRTKFNKTYYRLFAFWDKTDKIDTVVISTHGLVKKVDKIPKSEIDRAEKLRTKYFNEKTNKK